MTTEERFNNLPQWVKAHIETISKQRDSAIRQLGEFLDNQTESSIYVQKFSNHISPPSFIKKYIQGDRVTFGNIDVRLVTEQQGTWLHISALSGRLTIRPQSSNTIRLMEEQ